MTALVDIQKVLSDWFSAATGIDPIWMNKANPRPAKPYGGLQIISGPTRLGMSDELRAPAYSKASEEVLTVGMRRSVLNCQGFGSTSYDLLVAAQDSLQDSVVRATLKREQTTTISIDSVLDLTEYTITIEGNPIVITSDADATDLEIRDALVVAITADTDIDKYIVVEDGATDDELIVSGRAGRSFSIAVDAKMSIDSQINSVGLSYIRDDGILYSPELLETIWEDRHTMDVHFFSNSVIVDSSADLIETVEASGTVGNVVIPAWEI